LEKVIALFEDNPKFLVVGCDNIGSKFMQEIRINIRSTGGALLMGKNTLIQKALKSRIEDHPEWEQILPFIKQNVGIIFTKGSLAQLREKLLQNTRPAAAKVGAIAPDDFVLLKQVTRLEPAKTSFFAALNIGTKITKGCVEILNDVKICEKGKKVGSSEASLLQLLDLKPFTYGPKIINCYNGSMFSPKILDFTETELFKLMSEGIGLSAALSMALSYPNLSEFPRIIKDGFNNLVSVSLETNYDFKQAEGIKNYLNTLNVIPTTIETHDDSEIDDVSINRIELDVVDGGNGNDEELINDNECILDFFSF